MADNQTPIAWLALEEGTPIYARDGDELGKVADVIADREKDIFSGITFRPGLLEGPLFVPASKIDEITTDAVRLSLSSAEAGELQTYEG